MTGNFFQALPTQTDTVALIYKIEGNKPSTYTTNVLLSLYTLLLGNKGQLFGGAH
jgi:hypothetical protein